MNLGSQTMIDQLIARKAQPAAVGSLTKGVTMTTTFPIDPIAEENMLDRGKCLQNARATIAEILEAAFAEDIPKGSRFASAPDLEAFLPEHALDDICEAWVIYDSYHARQAARTTPRYRIKTTNQHEPELLVDGIKCLFNCKEAEVSMDGNVWIAGPQNGHWLKDDGLELVVRALERGDI